MTTTPPTDTRPEPFRCDVRPDGDSVHLVPVGELDLATVEPVREALSEAASAFKLVVLDLSQLRFMDSSGLRLVLQVDAESRRDGFSLALVAGPPAVQRIFEVAGVLDRLDFRSA